jgi:hypothetical protein
LQEVYDPAAGCGEVFGEVFKVTARVSYLAVAVGQRVSSGAVNSIHECRRTSSLATGGRRC